MLGGYFASATSEWLIGSPVLAVIARYAPASLNALMVGAYSLTVGAGMYWGSKISGFASPVVKTGAFQSRHSETLFGVLGVAALGLVIISLLVA
ncbi:hypothetical protein AD948_13285 [Acetobacter senegalensis]|uniref:Uncharacterized protein n=1 Tax=Acetobacter senegalensis TaxID=446692 RepID=A0A149TX10_9PROT|nr:hypothetical protein [Acetobacter senegalensis]KXV57745.1 hypothetical protein AD948_13285 [Acetobacter senegalensis]